MLSLQYQRYFFKNYFSKNTQKMAQTLNLYSILSLLTLSTEQILSAYLRDILDNYKMALVNFYFLSFVLFI